MALIPAGFDPRLNYQEVVFAQALHRMGHDVTVFTTTHGTLREKTDWTALDAALPFPVVRSARVLAVKSTHFPWDWTMRGRIRAFAPDLAILLAPVHGAGVCWMKHLPAGCRVISGFSDIPWHRGGKGLVSAVKRRWARKVFRRSSLVLSATVETTALLQEWGGDLLDGKLEFSGLSFDPASLDSKGDLPAAAAELRGRVRKLGAMVTRLIPEKQIDVLFGSVESFLTAHPDAGFVMGGFTDDAESARIRARIGASPVADRCVLLPILTSSRIGDLFRMADFTLWGSVSIGLYHSLACGSPVVLRRGVGSAQHLIDEGVNGCWFDALDDAAGAMARVTARTWDRAALVARVEPFFTDNLLTRLLDRAMSAPVSR